MDTNKAIETISPFVQVPQARAFEKENSKRQTTLGMFVQ